MTEMAASGVKGASVGRMGAPARARARARARANLGKDSRPSCRRRRWI